MAANAAMTLVRDTPLALTFLVRVFLLFGEARFVRGAWTSCRLALLRNNQSLRDRFRETLLGCLTISQLASRVTCDDADRTFFAEAGGKPREQPRALIVIERFRKRDIPAQLDTR